MLEPQSPSVRKLGTCSLSAWEAETDRQIPEDCWTANLVVKLRANERPCLKNKVDDTQGCFLVFLSLGTHVCMHTYIHIGPVCKYTRQQVTKVI